MSQGDSFLGERDCGEALRPGESTRGSSRAYFWLDGTRQNNNGLISKLVKQDTKKYIIVGLGYKRDFADRIIRLSDSLCKLIIAKDFQKPKPSSGGSFHADGVTKLLRDERLFFWIAFETSRSL